MNVQPGIGIGEADEVAMWIGVAPLFLNSVPLLACW